MTRLPDDYGIGQAAAARALYLAAYSQGRQAARHLRRHYGDHSPDPDDVLAYRSCQAQCRAVDEAVADINRALAVLEAHGLACRWSRPIIRREAA